MEGDLRQAAYHLICGICQDNGCLQETTGLHGQSCAKSEWSSPTNNRVFNQALVRSFREKLTSSLKDMSLPRENYGKNRRFHPLRKEVTTEAGSIPSREQSLSHR